MTDIKTEFEKAAKDVQTLKRKPDNQTMLQLYALYKQATGGDISGKRPGFTDPVGQAKYDAWKKIQGTSREAAMQSYVGLVNRLMKA